MKPKVMIVIDTGAIGGPGKGIFQLIDHTSRDEFNYGICTFGYDGKSNSEFIDYAQENDYELHVLRERFRFDPKTLSEAAKIFRDERFTIVQSHGYKGHVLALFLSKRFQVPWLGLTHGWTYEKLKRITAYRVLERRLLRLPQQVVTVSPAAYNEISKLRPRRPTHLIYNAVDPATMQGNRSREEVRAECNCQEKTLLIGTIGRLSPEKGHHIFLDAIRQLIHEHDQLRFVIVGEGGELATLRQQVSTNDLDAHVQFHPYTRAVRDYYQAMDLFVLPSLSEGLPNVLLESMAMGVPAIATDVGAVREVIQDNLNGWIVRPGSADALASKIRDVVMAPHELSRVRGAVAASLFPKFDPRERGKRFCKIYSILSEASKKTG